MAQYTVKQGDCIESIALRYGLSWEQLWNHPSNHDLKEKRRNPNVLMPGDGVFIPEKELRWETGATEQKHRFRKKGVPSKLRLVIKDEEDNPRPGLPYILEVDGQLSSGKTDTEGLIEQTIAPKAVAGKLRIGTGEEEEEYALQLGRIDPISEISGVQSRLRNLGIECGSADGVLGQRTIEALKQFQEKYGLQPTGELDEQTRGKLYEIHGF